MFADADFWFVVGCTTAVSALLLAIIGSRTPAMRRNIYESIRRPRRSPGLSGVLSALEEADQRLRGRRPRDAPEADARGGSVPPPRPPPETASSAVPYLSIGACCAVLGIDRDTATREVIEDAFRRAALRNHPDKIPDDPYAAARFRTIQEARDRLLEIHREEGGRRAGGDPAPPTPSPGR